MVRREEKPVDLSKAAPRRAPCSPARRSPIRHREAGRRRRRPPQPIRRAPSASRGACAPFRSGPTRAAMPRPRRRRSSRRRSRRRADANAAGHAAAATAAGLRADDTPRSRGRAASSRTPLRSSPPAPAGNAPLSLSPDANNAAAAAGRAGQLPAAAAPRAAPRRAGGLGACRLAGGGSYLVQVSSQRSEADARERLSRHPVEVSERARQPAAHRPPRRPRRQGRLLPRHGRAVRQPRRGGPALQQPEAGRRRLRCAALRRSGALCLDPRPRRKLIRADGATRFHHRTCPA